MQSGAVLSRHLMQQCIIAEVNSSMQNPEHYLSDVSVARQAVIHAGRQQYGETIFPDVNSCDFKNLRKWMQCPQRRMILEDEIVEIFVDGRYAPYNRGDETELEWMRMAVGLHPQVIEHLQYNGFYFTDEYLTTM